MSDNNGLFVRNATGLVRAWSVFDAFIYATFSINLITLGLYIFSLAPYIPNGHLVPAVVISGAFILLEVVVYAMLISVMPRAGGDYVWQSRILGGSWGFVLAVTGWVFCLWLWVPLYGNMLVWNVLTPILTLLGSITGSTALVSAGIWFSSTNGLFLGAILVIALAFIFVSLGMKWYARMQKISFYLGMAGLATLFLLLIFNNQGSFAAAFNSYAGRIFGAGPESYNQIMAAAAQEGYQPLSWRSMGIWASLPLIPMVVFFNLWPNWGATLYGEVRGATEFKRNFWGMAMAVVVTTVLAVILLGLIAKTIGWEFYHAANYAFYAGTSSYPIFPFPGLLAAYLTNSPLLQLWLIVSLSAWFFGWVGTVFMSSTRVLFAAAFDRMLPGWIAEVNPRTRSPINALLLMTVPSIAVSLLYYYAPGFSTLTMDSTVVLTITFLGSTVAALILPFKEKDLYNASPVARYKIFGLPVISVAAAIFGAFLLYNLYMWIADAVYGVNNIISALFMLFLYALSLALFLIYRGRNKKQGLDLDKVYREIPFE